MASFSSFSQIYKHMTPPQPFSLILASASPRRSHLLEQAGFTFAVRPQHVDEVYPDDMLAEEVAPYLAQLKAKAAGKLLQDDHSIVLTADSVVILDGVIYEKPRDANDARRMLRALSGQEHTVITGVCLRSRKKEKVFSGVTHVQFEHLTDEEIDYYIEQYQPFDKAGSYAIQEWIGLCKISGIRGTYANVMGLPVDMVYRELLDW